MANLNIGQIAGQERYEYRATVLVEKVFQLKGKKNNFMTDSGLFHASSIFVDGKEYKKDQTKKIPDLILALKGTRKPLELRGKLSGKKIFTTLDIKNIEKGEEFGGQPAGGKKENRGIKFEKDLFARFKQCLTGNPCKGDYAKQAERILEIISGSDAMNSPSKDADGSKGAKNTPRPIMLSAGAPIISPAQPENHGEKLSDIDIIHDNGKRSYLSLKFSSTLTFINSGVAAKYFPGNEIKTGTVKKPDGVAILKTLGIDNERFCKVFNNYGKPKKAGDPSHKVDVSLIINKTGLKKLLQTAMGANYWMVHGMPGGKVYFWEMSTTLNNNASRISGPIMLYYGGMDGKGKRIDMTFSNSYFEFKLNIRNKQGGLYPSHLMLDYKSLQGTGKEELPS